jgi:hypothetical protein
VFGRSLQCEPVRKVETREEFHGSHACKSFTREGVGTNGILESKILSENAHRTLSATIMMKVRVPLKVAIAITNAVMVAPRSCPKSVCVCAKERQRDGGWVRSCACINVCVKVILCIPLPCDARGGGGGVERLVSLLLTIFFAWESCLRQLVVGASCAHGELGGTAVEEKDRAPVDNAHCTYDHLQCLDAIYSVNR